jgi:hypothetical protein
VALSYARILVREVLIQNLIEHLIQSILVSLRRIIYLLLALYWAACANGIRYVLCEGAFQFDLALGVELLQQSGLAFYSIFALGSLQQSGFPPVLSLGGSIASCLPARCSLSYIRSYPPSAKATIDATRCVGSSPPNRAPCGTRGAPCEPPTVIALASHEPFHGSRYPLGSLRRD